MSELGMDRVSPKYHAWPLLVAALLAPFAALGSRFFASLHESRRRQAEQIIERHSHLTEKKADRPRSRRT
jgi:hypothetical protein